MEQIMNYIKPELVVVAIVLYFVGMALKQSQTVKDKFIWIVLGCVGIILATIYVVATSAWDNAGNRYGRVYGDCTRYFSGRTEYIR